MSQNHFVSVSASTSVQPSQSTEIYFTNSQLEETGKTAENSVFSALSTNSSMSNSDRDVFNEESVDSVTLTINTNVFVSKEFNQEEKKTINCESLIILFKKIFPYSLN